MVQIAPPPLRAMLFSKTQSVQTTLDPSVAHSPPPDPRVTAFLTVRFVAESVPFQRRKPPAPPVHVLLSRTESVMTVDWNSTGRGEDECG
jgi:hypothetical protein